MPKSSPFAKEEAPSGAKTLKEYIEAKLTVAGFDFLQQNSDIIAWPHGSEEEVIYLKWHDPGAYSVEEAKGFFEQLGRQKALQNQIVNWVYEYYAGGAYVWR